RRTSGWPGVTGAEAGTSSWRALPPQHDSFSRACNRNSRGTTPVRTAPFHGWLPGSEWRRSVIESSQRLGRHRWVVERTMAWLAGCRRLHRRYERKAEHFLAFTSIACTLICYRRLAK
ncbi:transposase, partial [Streptomyces sp. NPDC097981]|uniref:transposase n=1 Tax=Streptomyces sp. NPDC097981 TaxID=3155428 RepID=UPI003316A55A